MEYNDKTITDQSNDVIISMGSALVGYVLGGPMGAVVANTSLPIAKLTTKIFEGWLEKRARRMNSVVNDAISESGMSEDDVLQRVQDNPELIDTVVMLLQHMFETDSEFDSIYAILLSRLFHKMENDEEQRLIILGNSIRGLNKVQLSIIVEMGQRGGQMSAEEISSFLSIPEWELRNAVRDLELRGIITDNETNPTIWYLRELGQALLKIRNLRKNE